MPPFPCFYLVGILPTLLFLSSRTHLSPAHKHPSNSKLQFQIPIYTKHSHTHICIYMAMLRPHQYSLHRLLLNNDIKILPTNGSRTSGYSSDSKFDSNMVIILAALLCVLIFALGLNSIVRCALRCSQRFAFDTPEQAATRLTTTGIKKESLSQIPVVVYRSGLNIPATDCPICIGEFNEGETVRILPGCNHGFHVKCIDKWFVSHSSCPICRQLLFENSPPVTN